MWYLLGFPIGWLGGWIVNYLSDVLPRSRSFSQPRCPKCKKSFPWGAYLLLRNCPSCGRPRSRRTLIVMAVMVAAAVVLGLLGSQLRQIGLHYALAELLTIYLAVVMVIDLEHRLILHPVSLAGALLGFWIGITIHSVKDTLIGGIFGFGVMLLFYYVGVAYVRFMARRKKMPSDEVALGFGDVNLSGILGLILGWPSIVMGLLFGILVGGLVSLGIMIAMAARKEYKAFTAIPYAPFLILSVLLIFVH